MFTWEFLLPPPPPPPPPPSGFKKKKILCGEFLLHIPCCLHFYGEFLLHIPCWLHFYVGSFSYTSLAGFVFILGVSLTHPELVYFFMAGVSLTHPVLTSLLSGEFLLHILCWLYFSVRSFSYTSHTGFKNKKWGGVSLTNFHAGFIFICVVSVKHPFLPSFLCSEFYHAHPLLFFFFFFNVGSFLHIPCCLHFYVGSFSYTSCARFTFLFGVSLTQTPTGFLKQKMRWSFSYKFRAGFIFICVVSLKHP